LPAGSVRSLLAFSVLGLSWAIVLLRAPDERLPLVFTYLQVLTVVILATFFAAHGRSIGPQVSTRSPLGLPRGSVRFLLLAGYGGLAYFLYHHARDFDLPPSGKTWFLLLPITGFFVGHVVSRCVQTLAGGVEPYWYQDLQAWISLVAMGAMAIVVVVHVFINPSLRPSQQLDMPTLEAFLSVVVGFYFGART
jgi:hypothetical protein